jgi:hypothetical protein
MTDADGNGGVKAAPEKSTGGTGGTISKSANALAPMIPYGLVVGGLVGSGFFSSTTGTNALLAIAASVPILPSLLTEPGFWHEVSLALVIAGFATLTIEKLRVKTFTSELSAAVDAKLTLIENTTRDAIFRGPLPRAYYEYVKSVMLLDRFLVTGFRFTMELETLTDKAGYLKLRFDQEYRVTNLNDIEREYTVESFEDLDLDDIFPNTTQIKYVRARSEGSPTWRIHEHADTDATLGIVENDRRVFRKELLLKRGETLIVQAGTEEIVLERDNTGLVIGGPNMGVHSTVFHPSSVVVDVDFPKVYGTDAKTFDPKIDSQELDASRVRSDWEFPFPMLPGSEITVRWVPRQVRPSSETTPAKV